MANQFVFLKRLRSTEREMIDLFHNEQDGWYRLRKIKASIESADADVKIISLSPDEMRELTACIPVPPIKLNPLQPNVDVVVKVFGQVGSGRSIVLDVISNALIARGCKIERTDEHELKVSKY